MIIVRGLTKFRRPSICPISIKMDQAMMLMLDEAKRRRYPRYQRSAVYHHKSDRAPCATRDQTALHRITLPVSIHHRPDEPMIRSVGCVRGWERVLAALWLNAVSTYRAWMSHENDDPGHRCTSYEQRKHTSARDPLPMGW